MEEPRPPQPTSRLVKVSVFVGLYLLRVLDGMPWIWGNFVVYINSYLYATGNRSSVQLTGWVFSSSIIGFNAGILIGNSIARRLGVSVTLFLGLLLTNTIIVCGSWFIQNSVVGMIVVYGAMEGLVGGVNLTSQLTLLVRWTKRYHALAVSAANTSCVLGAVAINFMLTLYINPRNEAPDATFEDQKLFSQEEIVERVPNAFILFGGLSAALNFTGFIFVRENPGESIILVEWFRKARKSTKEGLLLLTKRTSSQTSNGTFAPLDGNGSGNENEAEEERSLTPDDVKDSSNDVTPCQALRHKDTYVLWVFTIVTNYAFYILNAYYKTFGLLHIPDDHFLTTIVMFKCLCTPVYTWLLGIVMDHLGVKVTIVSATSLFCIVASFFYLTVINKWLYLVSCVAYGCTTYSLWCLISACCVKIFGKTHFTTILGMVSTSAYITLFSMPPLTEWLISSFGWFVLFTSVGVLGLLVVLMLICCLSDKTVVQNC